MRETESGDFRRKERFLECTHQAALRTMRSCSGLGRFEEWSRARSSCVGRHSQRSIFTICVLLVSGFTTPVQAAGGEHLETLRNASVVSSSRLKSGSGSGMFRLYEAIAEGEWELKLDSEITTHFVGRTYYIELVFNPEFRGLKCRRILKNDRSMRTAVFSPGMLAGAPAWEVKPENRGDGLVRPPFDDISWDVSLLSQNVWNLDDLIRRVPQERIKIVETADGDLFGSYSGDAQSRFQEQFECPKRFGFNIARLRSTNPGDHRPSHEIRVEWKQTESGLWYVRSLQEDWQSNNGKAKKWRRVLKYTDFKANVNIEPRVFTAEFLRRPMGDQ
jgi:hypothetical protein